MTGQELPSFSKVMISASQLNTYLFCPRLLFLEAVLGCEGSNIPSEEGRFLHDKLATEEVFLESPVLGLCGRIDVYREEGVPIEYKRGHPLPDGLPWPGHAVQLCAMALLLEAVEKIPVRYGYIWYQQTRERVQVDFSCSLREETCQTIEKAACLLNAKALPLPLENRKACLGCNQYRNCLPDELQGTPSPAEAKTILAPHVEGQAVYIDRPGSKLSVKEGSLQITEMGQDKKISIGLDRINQLVIQQPASCTSSLLENCAKKKIPIMLLDFSGRWQGSLYGSPTRNVMTRMAQYGQFQDDAICFDLSKTLISAKLHNQRVWLRRHLSIEDDAVNALTRAGKAVSTAKSIQALMGIEGEAAKNYYAGFSRMLGEDAPFQWLGRQKHPNPDPINSLLSFGYALLMQQVMTGCELAGLDPYLGFYHGLKHGKPSLALDLMEIYRTPVVDAAVLGFLNRRQCAPSDFEIVGSSCTMKPNVRKAFVQALFERLRTSIKHPTFGYDTLYQRAIHVEARLLNYALLSGLDLWKPFRWR